MKVRRSQAVGGLVAGVALWGVTCAPEGGPSTPTVRISEFGGYEGYSTERFDSWVRTSEYVVVRDGTRLAIDVVRPALQGQVAEEPLPVIWTHSRYHRTPARLGAALSPGSGSEGPGLSATDSTETSPVPSFVDTNPGLQRLLRHGYVFVGVAVRGSGASFGRYEGLFSPAETRDAYDIMEWISTQPWSDGNLGMTGGSYLGITQYMAASTSHPSLRAIFPTVSLFDLYDALYPGGVYREDMIRHWGLLTRTLDTQIEAPPVDDDEGGRLLKAAIQEHMDSWVVEDGIGAARLRSDIGPEFSYQTHSPSSRLDSMNATAVAAYHWGGWYDAFAMDETLWFRNWTGPDLLGMGPWSHAFLQGEMASERARLEALEQHRFFDFFLKGINNGLMDEPPVRYAVVDDFDSWWWTSAEAWPPPDATPTTYYLAAGPSGTIDSANDGILSTTQYAAGDAADTYQVDPTTTTGAASRWDNAVGQGPMHYPDMTPNDRRSLTYTTPPLEAPLAVVGHPVATLYVSADQDDFDVYVLLEEVTPDGFSRYVTEGMLRASHRIAGTPPWDNMGLPYQPSRARDLATLEPDSAVALTLDLQPTATLFNAGNRLRITIMGADADNTEPPPSLPRIRVHRSSQWPSQVSLPILDEDAPAGPAPGATPP